MEVAGIIQVVQNTPKYNLPTTIFLSLYIFQLYEYLAVINSLVVDLIIQK
jgi:hypothetical protein